MTTEASDTICQSILGSAMILPQILRRIQSVYKQLILLKILVYTIILFIFKSGIKLLRVFIVYIINENVKL